MVVALTNNFTPSGTGGGSGSGSGLAELVPLFDHFIESRLVGLRKPDPAIYKHALEMVSVVLVAVGGSVLEL